MRKSFVIVFHGYIYIEENMAIDRHSSWPDIRLWKQGWTVAINQTGGGIWWQRLNECKKHQSASDYCNCHQIPPRPLTGHADPLAPPHTHISHHQQSSTLYTTGALPGTPMNISGHTHAVHLSFHTCRKFFSAFFFHLSEMSCTQKGLMWPLDFLIQLILDEEQANVCWPLKTEKI